MTIARSRTAAVLVVLLGMPFLFAADGSGCDAKTACAPLPCPSGAPWDPSTCTCTPLDAGSSSDAGLDADAGCVSTEGQHCGGNIATPCTCATGLVCTPGDGGLPFGDVGGTCERAFTP